MLPATFADRAGGAFTVRHYRTADRVALEAMYDSFEPLRVAQGLPPGSAEARSAWLDAILPEGIHVVVEVNGAMLGHGMLLPYDGMVELANFLHQSIRNRGIGTTLNRVLVDLAALAGYDRVWLSVEPSNRAAIRSYESAGFQRLPGSLWGPEIEMEARTGTAGRE